MPTDHRARLAGIRRFDQLVAYLRDEMGWPIEGDDFEELTFEYTPEELGIDSRSAAKIKSIKRLRPLSPGQPWGIFFVKFEPKRLPVVALRRILSQVALKKRASANSSERAAWAADDLLFISNYGEGDERQISFAHFSAVPDSQDLPTLKVLGWDDLDTALHLDAVARELTEQLAWPDDQTDADAWRRQWRAAFSARYREIITTSRDLSIRLAELARAIRKRIKAALAIETETETGQLTKLMKAFQAALVHDLDADGFADMYAQTIAYGLLSARIAYPHKKTVDDFASHMRTNPFLRELMETFLKVGGRRGKAGGPGIDFDELGVSEVVELLDDANMEAVVRDFGDRNPQEDPVIHFYELFLKEYDAGKRMQRGVFYTPRPVVSYIVRSVDELLRTEFGLVDGLADTTTWGEMTKRNKDLKMPEGVWPDQDFIQILDPATGTGTFLVEVIDVIHTTLVAKWKAQGHGAKKIDALWNEYVPKHLLTRLHGYELLMAPYAIAHLKIGLKLYETGYRFGSAERVQLFLTNALEPAHDLSGKFAFAIPALAHEAQAVNAVKATRRFTAILGNPPYSNFGQLNRIPVILELLLDYKRGLDEKKINLDDDFIKFVRFAQHLSSETGAATVGLITNHVYLDGLTHRRMRQALLETFERVDILDLHGSAQKQESAPDGGPDENVFDIKQGVAISLLVLRAGRQREVRVGGVFGTRREKYAALSRLSIGLATRRVAVPCPPNFFFRLEGTAVRPEYEGWQRLPTVMPFYNSGIQTKRDGLTIHFRRDDLDRVLSDFRCHDAEWLRQEYDLGADGRDWTVDLAKQDTRAKGKIIQVQYRPFDYRFTYFTGNSKGFLAYPRRDVSECILGGSIALVTMRQLSGVPDECEVFVTKVPMTDRSMASTLGTPYLFPLRSPLEGRLFLERADTLNYSTEFLQAMQTRLGSASTLSPEDVFRYLYAVFHSPGYRRRYAEALRIDFPRVPLPVGPALFRDLAQLGGLLVSLHLLDSPKLTDPMTEFIRGRIPEVEKVSWSRNTVWLDKAQTTGFLGVREDVWKFHIGGYQVCEKWLKDRKGRTLSSDDIAHYKKIVFALSETIRLMKEIDEVIEAHGGWPGAFQGAVGGTT